LVIVLAVRTITRNENWKDGLALFSHDDAIVDRMSPQGSFDLENNYGVELFRAGLVEQAGEHFKKSISLQPAWSSSQNNLGAVLERQGDLEGALAQYRKSITAGNYYLAYENEGGILMKLKRYGEAKTFLEDSLAIFPQNERLQFSLAVIYAADDIGNVADSKQKSMLLLSQVLSQDPQNQRAIQLYLMLKNNQKFEL
jgi:tetratricopeptide (TPR) repeat protein